MGKQHAIIQAAQFGSGSKETSCRLVKQLDISAINLMLFYRIILICNRQLQTACAYFEFD